jgi:collagen type I alpha
MRVVFILSVAGLLAAADNAFAAGSTGTSWLITGNAGTSASDFLGTTSNQPVIFKAYGKEALRVLPSGLIGIGTTTPTARLDIDGVLRATGLQLPTGAKGGYVLTSNASGGAAWAAAKAGAEGPAGPRGETGAQGQAGAKGSPGAEGPVGPTGPQGAMGAVGPAGATGAAGPTGPAGPTGAQGPAGFISLPYSNTVASNQTLLSLTNSAGTDATDFYISGGNGSSYGNAVYAYHGGGSTSALGEYGSAGFFASTNKMNQSAAVYAAANGPGGAGYFLTTSSDTKVSNSNANPATVTGINEGGLTTAIGAYGPAGYFETTNVDNSAGTLEGITYGQGGRGVVGQINNGGYGVHAEDDTNAGFSVAGYALEADSSHGVALRASGGSSGTGNCYFNGGSGFNCSSDRNLKEDFKPVDGAALLDLLDGMPIFTYRMKKSDDKAIYLGPTAQDFKAAFHLGVGDDTVINTANAQGVALAATKGLYERVKQDEATIAALKQHIAEQDAKLNAMASLETSMTRLEATVRQLETTRPTVRAAFTRP